MCERVKIPEQIIAALRVPLPKEAIKAHPTKPYLSTIKTIYSIERMNEVFGMNGWFDRYEVVQIGEPKAYEKAGKTLYTSPMVVVKGVLTIPEYGIRREAFGGHDNEDLGDAYKGACTDALSKMVSALYIGMDVYKGHPNDPAPHTAPVAQNQATTASVTPKPSPVSHNGDPVAEITIAKVEDGEKKLSIEIRGKLAGTKYLGCFDKKLLSAFESAIDVPAKVCYRTREYNGKTYVNITHLLEVNGTEYSDGVPVIQRREDITDDDIPF